MPARPLIVAVRCCGAILWSAGVFSLPEGNLLWAPAALASVFPWILGRIFHRPVELCEPGGVWWGLAVFAFAIPFSGFPYRPEALWGVLSAGVLLAWGITMFRLRARGKKQSDSRPLGT
jgi:hypothetical protein